MSDLRGMKSTKSFKERQRDKRIQKEVERLGGKKAPPKVKTLSANSSTLTNKSL